MAFLEDINLTDDQKLKRHHTDPIRNGQRQIGETQTFRINPEKLTQAKDRLTAGEDSQLVANGDKTPEPEEIVRQAEESPTDDAAGGKMSAGFDYLMMRDEERASRRRTEDLLTKKFAGEPLTRDERSEILRLSPSIDDAISDRMRDASAITKVTTGVVSGFIGSQEMIAQGMAGLLDLGGFSDAAQMYRDYADNLRTDFQEGEFDMAVPSFALGGLLFPISIEGRLAQEGSGWVTAGEIGQMLLPSYLGVASKIVGGTRLLGRIGPKSMLGYMGIQAFGSGVTDYRAAIIANGGTPGAADAVAFGVGYAIAEILFERLGMKAVTDMAERSLFNLGDAYLGGKMLRVMSIVNQNLISGGTEMTEEMATQLAQNLMGRFGFYAGAIDPDRPLLAGVPEAGLLGLIGGQALHIAGIGVGAAHRSGLKSNLEKMQSKQMRQQAKDGRQPSQPKFRTEAARAGANFIGPRQVGEGLTLPSLEEAQAEGDIEQVIVVMEDMIQTGKDGERDLTDEEISRLTGQRRALKDAMEAQRLADDGDQQDVVREPLPVDQAPPSTPIRVKSTTREREGFMEDINDLAVSEGVENVNAELVEEADQELEVAAEAIFSGSGTEVIFWRNKAHVEGTQHITGVVDRQRFGRRIFINVDADNTDMIKRTMSHEMVHILEETAEYVEFVQRIQARDPGGLKAAGNSYTDSLRLFGADADSFLATTRGQREAVARYIEVRALERGFWDELVGRKPTLVRRFIQTVDRVMASLGNVKAGIRIDEIQTMRDLAAAALSQRGSQGVSEDVDAESQLNVRIDGSHNGRIANTKIITPYRPMAMGWHELATITGLGPTQFSNWQADVLPFLNEDSKHGAYARWWMSSSGHMDMSEISMLDPLPGSFEEEVVNLTEGRLGVEVVWADVGTQDAMQAIMDYPSPRIVLPNNLTLPDQDTIFTEVWAHEVVHTLQEKKFYQTFLDNVIGFDGALLDHMGTLYWANLKRLKMGEFTPEQLDEVERWKQTEEGHDEMIAQYIGIIAGDESAAPTWWNQIMSGELVGAEIMAGLAGKYSEAYGHSGERAEIHLKRMDRVQSLLKNAVDAHEMTLNEFTPILGGEASTQFNVRDTITDAEQATITGAGRRNDQGRAIRTTRFVHLSRENITAEGILLKFAGTGAIGRERQRIIRGGQLKLDQAAVNLYTAGRRGEFVVLSKSKFLNIVEGKFNLLSKLDSQWKSIINEVTERYGSFDYGGMMQVAKEKGYEGYVETDKSQPTKGFVTLWRNIEPSEIVAAEKLTPQRMRELISGEPLIETPAMFTRPGATNAVLQHVIDNGGITYEPFSDTIEVTGYAVSPFPERGVAITKSEQVNGKVTEAQIKGFLDANEDILSGNPATRLGVWFDNGSWYLDIVEVHSNERSATGAAIAGSQEAIFHLDKGREIRVQSKEEAAVSRAANDLSPPVVTEADRGPDEPDVGAQLNVVDELGNEVEEITDPFTGQQRPINADDILLRERKAAANLINPRVIKAALRDMDLEVQAQALAVPLLMGKVSTLAEARMWFEQRGEKDLAASGEPLGKVRGRAKGIKSQLAKLARANRPNKFRFAPPNIQNGRDRTKLKKRLIEMARIGVVGRFWYEGSGRHILNQFGGDKVAAEQFVQLISIMSATNPLQSNWQHASLAWLRWQADMEIHGFTESGREWWIGKYGWQGRTADALLAEGTMWEGRKTGSFYKNLMREIDPEGLGNPNQFISTIDIHIMRGMGYPTEAPTTPQYKWAEDLMKDVMADLNKDVADGDPLWETQQVQSAIWVTQKAIRPGKKQKKELAALLKDGMLPIPSDPLTTSVDFSNISEWQTGHVDFNAIPHESTGILPELLTASHLVQQAYTAEVMAVFYDEDGFDIIARELGLLKRGSGVSGNGLFRSLVRQNFDIVGSELAAKRQDRRRAMRSRTNAVLDRIKAGATISDLRDALLSIGEDAFFVDETVPMINRDTLKDWKVILRSGIRAEERGSQTTQQVWQTLRDYADSVLTDARVSMDVRKLLDVYAAAVGQVLHSPEVHWYRPFWKGTKKDSNGISYEFGREMTFGEHDTLTEEIEREFGGDVVLHPAENGLHLVYFGDAGPKGVANGDFQNRAKKLLERVLPEEVNAELKLFATDHGSQTNDYSENLDGENYQREIGLAGRPDIQRIIDTVIRPKIAEIQARWRQAIDRGSVQFNVEGPATAANEDGEKPPVVRVRKAREIYGALTEASIAVADLVPERIRLDRDETLSVIRQAMMDAEPRLRRFRTVIEQNVLEIIEFAADPKSGRFDPSKKHQIVTELREMASDKAKRANSDRRKRIREASRKVTISPEVDPSELIRMASSEDIIRREKAKNTRDAERKEFKRKANAIIEKAALAQREVRRRRNELLDTIIQILPAKFRPADLIRKINQIKTDKQLKVALGDVLVALNKVELRDAKANLLKVVNSVKLSSLPAVYKQAMEERIGNINFQKLTQKTRDRLQTIQNMISEDPAMEETFSKRERESLVKLSNTEVDDMTAAEMNLLSEQVKVVSKNAREFGKTFKRGKKVRIELLEAAVVGELTNEREAREPQPSGQARVRQAMNIASLPFKMETNLKPDALAALQSGSEGMFWETFFKDLVDSQRSWLRNHHIAVDVMEGAIDDAGIRPGDLATMSRVFAGSYGLFTAPIEAIRRRRAGKPGDLRSGETRAAVVIDEDGLEGILLESNRRLVMTKAERMHLVAMLMDMDNYDLIVNSGAPVTLKQGQAGDNFRLTRNDVLKIRASMTTAESLIVARTVEHMNTVMKAKLAAWSITSKGRDITKGDIHVSRHRVRSGDAFAEPTLEQYVDATLNSIGLQKDRGTDIKSPVEIRDWFVEYNNISWGTFALTEMADTHATARKLLQRESVQRALVAAGGSTGYWERMLTNLAREATGQGDNNGPFSSVIGSVINNLTKALLAVNPRVVMYQPASMLVANSEIEMKYLVIGGKSIGKSLTNNAKDIDNEIRTHSPTLRARFDSTALSVMNEFTGGGRILKGQKTSISDRMMAGIQWGDRIAIRTIWMASTAKVDAEFAQLTGDERMRKIAEIAEGVVSRTQPVWGALHTSGLGAQAKRIPVIKLVTMFMAQRNQNINMAVRGLMRYNRDPSQKLKAAKDIAMVAVGQTMFITAIAALWEWALGGFDDDDGDEVAAWLGGRSIDVFVGNIYFGDFYSFVTQVMLGFEQPFEPDFSPLSGSIEQLGRAGMTLRNSGGPNDPKFWKGLEGLTTSGFSMTPFGAWVAGYRMISRGWKNRIAEESSSSQKKPKRASAL